MASRDLEWGIHLEICCCLLCYVASSRLKGCICSLLQYVGQLRRERIAGDDIGMVLSPQCFHNLNLHEDIFNHSNIHFWEYMQPGYDALGFISCTGEIGQLPVQPCPSAPFVPTLHSDNLPVQ